jgi:thiamine kinase-like enzyme
VISFDQEDTGAFNSQTSHFVLRYSSETPPSTPTLFVIKRNSQREGLDEVKFYNLINSLPDHPRIIVPCYTAAYDEESGNSYLFLRDLSATHAPPVTREQQINIVEGVPSPPAIEQVVETLAQLHAYWWEHPLLETEMFDIGYWSRNAERFELYLQRRMTSWKNLISKGESWFPEDLRDLYEYVFARLPYHWEHYLEPRFRTRTNITLTHGDSYFANFLYPKNPATDTTYLLDWQSPGFDIGGYDLANLCATFWTSEQRQEDQREQQILRRYHTALQFHGIQQYSWDNLLTDYKTGLIYWLLMPIQDCYGGSKRSYWWPKMQCLAAAFREWHCEELLSSV